MITPIVTGGEYDVPRLSPDGGRVAFLTDNDLWIRDLENDRDTRLTETDGIDVFPVWRPDGTTVTFTSMRGDGFHIYSRLADLSGQTELILSTDGVSAPGSWTPDGQTLVFYETNDRGNRDIWQLPVGGDPVPFLDTAFNERAPRLSPNGQWLAYISDQAGEDGIYVRAFPGGGPVIPISAGLGTEPVWSRDGRELFYRTADQLWVVDVETEAGFTAGSPRTLFEASYQFGFAEVGMPGYDVSLDGQQFLMVRRSAAAGYIVVENWFEELKRLVPVD